MVIIVEAWARETKDMNLAASPDLQKQGGTYLHYKIIGRYRLCSVLTTSCVPKTGHISPFFFTLFSYNTLAA